MSRRSGPRSSGRVGTSPSGVTVIDDFGHNPDKVAALQKRANELAATMAELLDQPTVTAIDDPAQTVAVPVGRRFAIMLPADPAHGWRWVVEPVDTRYLAPLGSEFRDDPALLERATTTTTTAPPPAPETTTVLPGQTTTTTAPPSTTGAPSTTTTAPGPLVQIISFAGRSPGVPIVTLHYERIGTGQDAPEPAQTLVFRVLVGTPPPPPASVPPPA